VAANPAAHMDTHAHQYSHTHPNSYADQYSHTHPNSYADQDVHANRHQHGDGDSDEHPNTSLDDWYEVKDRCRAFSSDSVAISRW